MDSIRTGFASFSLFMTVETAGQGSNNEVAGLTGSFYSILLWRRFPYAGILTLVPDSGDGQVFHSDMVSRNSYRACR